MADLLKWGRAVVAQINPWDGGADYNSVMREKKKRRPQQQQQAPQRPSFNGGPQGGGDRFKNPFDLNTGDQQRGPSLDANVRLSQQRTAPKPKLNDVDQGLNKGKSWEDIARETGRSVEQVKTYSQATRPNYGIPKKPDPVGKFVDQNLVKPAVSTLNKTVNTLQAPVTGAVGGAMVAADRAFNQGKNSQNLLRATNQQMNKQIKRSFVSPDVAAGKASPVKFAKEFTNAGVSVSDYLPIGGGAIQGAKAAGNLGIKALAANALKQAASRNLKEAAIYGTAYTANDAIQGREINAQRLAGNYAAPAAFGTVADVGARGIGAGIRGAKRYNDNLPVPMREGGFIAGPKASGYPDAQARGRVFADTPDGKPRFEVDDSGARLKKDLFTDEKLENILDHPELYRQYPELKNLRVISQNEFKNTPTNASYDRGANAIAVNPEHMRKGNDFKSTLLHEVQHAIQNKEAFANGGSAESAMGALLVKRDASRKALQEFFAKHRDAKGNVPDQHKAELKRLQDENRKLIDIEAMSRHTDGRHAYDRLAGEAEARAVQARMDMPMSERYVSGVNPAPEKSLPDMKNEFDGLLQKIRSRTATDADSQRYSILKDRIAVAEGKKGAPNPERWVADKPIKLPDVVYRGTSKDSGSGFAMFGGGKYTAASKAEAAKYGTVQTLGKESLPSNPLQFKTTQDFSQWEYEMARKLGVNKNELYDANKGAETLINAIGHDGVTIGTGKDLIAVKFSPETISQYKPRSTFYDSLDVPKEDLIIRNEGGKAMSVEHQNPVSDAVDDVLRQRGASSLANAPTISQFRPTQPTLPANTIASRIRQATVNPAENPQIVSQVRTSLSPDYPLGGNIRPRVGTAPLGRPQPPQSQPRLTPADTPRNPFNVNNTINNPVEQMSPQSASRYIDEMTAAREEARKLGNTTNREKIAQANSAFRRDIVDDLSPIEDRLNKAIKGGAQVDPANNITYQLDRARRAEGLTDAYIRDNNLEKIIQNVPDAKEFDQYLIARHARELDPEITTGRDAAKDAALVQALDQKYKPYAEELYGYNRKLLDDSVNYGLISRETAEQLKQRYPDYVPLNRVFNGDELQTIANGVGKGEASLSKQTVVQKRKGSQREIESPLESIIDKTRVAIEQGERNRSAQLLASYKDLPDNPFNLRELAPDEQIGSKHTISFLDNGVKRTFETDKDIAEAAKHIGREDIGFWGRVLAIPARALRAGATGVNAGFAGANVVKDVVGAAINSPHPMRIADPRNFGKALSAALHHNGKNYAELMREGVAGTSFDMYRNTKNLNVKEIRSHKNIGRRAAHNLTTPRQWYRTLENTIGRSEDFGRALQYYSNKSGYQAKGRPLSEAKMLAADQARHNSTNFFRHGAKGRNVNLAIPYWNAGVQGARIQGRRIIERPAQTLTKIGIAIAAPSAMIAASNYASEDRRKIMDNIPEYEKEGNIIILGANPKFNEKTNRWEDVYKFPVPPQHIGIHNTVQRAVESAYTGKEFDVVKSLGDIAQNYTTVNPTDAQKTIGQYTPQGLKLAAEPLTNTNFFTKEKIVPESMKNLDNKDQKYKSTSGVAKVLGDAFGISPLQIDNSLRTAFGGAGQNVVRLADLGLAGTGAIKKEDVRGQDLKDSILGRFVGARGTSEGRLYFDTLDEAAKKQKLAGKDVAIFNSMVNAKMGADGEIEGKNERDALNKYQNLASHPRVAKAIAEAAKDLAKKTDRPLDPLYQLSHEKQMKFYNIKAQNKDSQDQRDLENREASWYKDFSAKRREYFDKLDLKPSKNSKRVPYPEPDKKTQKVLDQYYAMENGEQKWAFMDAHPEITEHFNKLSKYSNDVRKGQGVNPLRTYPQASKEVQQMMDSGNFKHPAVSQYLQDLNMYRLTKGAALAQIQGNSLDSKELKALQGLGKYSVVKNADGTYSLKGVDTQGDPNNTQDEAGGSGGGYGKGGRKGGGKGKKGKAPSLKDMVIKSKMQKAPQKPNLGKKGPVTAATYKQAPIKQYQVRPVKKTSTRIKKGEYKRG